MTSIYLTFLLRIITVLFCFTLCVSAAPISDVAKPASFANAAYIQNSIVYQDGFNLNNYNFSAITHVLYAFANVNSDGTLKLSDPYADTQIILDGQSDGTGKLNGLLGALFEKKLDNPYLKVILSVGGASGSQAFAALANSALRTNFVNSAINMLEDYGLDGIDIDWETPSAGAQAAVFTSLLSEMRDALTQHANSKGDSVTYQLSVAAPAGTGNIQGLEVEKVDELLDYWNVMAYDYSGSWSSLSCSQDNVYNAQCSGVSTDNTIQTYVNMKATLGKINIGIPLYGHLFESTSGPDQSYNGVGSDGGTISFSELPQSGAQVTENTQDISAFSYNSGTRELVSFDTANIVKLKAQYVEQKKLGGLMYWDISQDKAGADSLVNVGGGALSLDTTLNHISYPASQFSNIRSNAGRSEPVATPSTSPVATSPIPSPTATTKSGQCSGVQAFSSSVAYMDGDKVTYNNHLYTAKWWTQLNLPSQSGQWGPWADNGSC